MFGLCLRKALAMLGPSCQEEPFLVCGLLVGRSTACDSVSSLDSFKSNWCCICYHWSLSEDCLCSAPVFWKLLPVSWAPRRGRLTTCDSVCYVDSFKSTWYCTCYYWSLPKFGPSPGKLLPFLTRRAIACVCAPRWTTHCLLFTVVSWLLQVHLILY